MITSGLMSSLTDDWGTPKEFFKEINKEFSFQLDVCASNQNYKCERYYTESENGLLQDWEQVNWCNPPYGRAIGKWIEKAHNEHLKGKTTVLLIPSRTDTKWFHDYIYQKHEIRFLKGRLKFNDGKNPAPFPSMIVIMKGKEQ